MNPDVKVKWVEALRSGKYKQTTGELHSERGYCCLGVLCDISGLGEWRSPIVIGRGYEFTPKDSGRCSRIELPPEVQQWAGVDACGNIPSKPDLGSLSLLNDQGNCFADIADIIEENL